MSKLKIVLKEKIDSVQKLTRFQLEQIESSELQGENTIVLRDRSDHQIGCQYEVLGMYHNKYNIWSWAHSLDFLRNNKYKLSSELPERLHLAPIHDLAVSDFLFFCFNQSNFHIEKKRLNLMLQYVIFVLDSIWIHPIPSEQNPDIHIYLVLNNILKY